MHDKIIRIATRQSPLALWQARYVQKQLMSAHLGLKVELVTMLTRGDILLDGSLSKLGGKGLFVKELELALLEGRADLAVHSMKDVPNYFPAGLGLVTICQRENPADALVSNKYSDLKSLPVGAIVGTSSLRRQCQLKAHYPHLQIKPLRGNVGTRLNKLDSGEYDAIILAAAGLIRLGLDSRIRTLLEEQISLPAAGQGAVGIECRLNASSLIEQLSPLNHPETAVCVLAERAMNIRLDGGCQVPIASYATLDNGKLWLRGLVGTPDGSRIISGERWGAAQDASKLGTELAEELLAKGAKTILSAVYHGQMR